MKTKNAFKKQKRTKTTSCVHKKTKKTTLLLHLSKSHTHFLGFILNVLRSVFYVSRLKIQVYYTTRNFVAFSNPAIKNEIKKIHSKLKLSKI